MNRKQLVYSLYERRLVNELQNYSLPLHIGVMLDGNRRWAKEAGHDVAEGYRRGANKIADLLSWCENLDINVLTLYLLSTDNLARDPAELEKLIPTIENAVAKIAASGGWRVHPIGALDLLPEATANHLREVERATKHAPVRQVNVAIGYGGRHEITDAVRSLLRDQAAQGIPMETLAQELTAEHIAEHLYTKGQPDPDLVIRTSGEQRLSGFLLWQSANTELYFHEAYWPDFRRVDFLRALRSYGQRERRYGT